MSVCVRIRGKRHYLCLGDLDREIFLTNRSITPPVFGSTDFLETFVNNEEPSWVMVEHVQGKTHFDGVETETPITHNFYMEYDEEVDTNQSEWWILFESRYFDILRIIDLDERHEWLKLICVERGDITKLAAHA